MTGLVKKTLIAAVFTVGFAPLLANAETQQYWTADGQDGVCLIVGKSMYPEFSSITIIGIFNSMMTMQTASIANPIWETEGTPLGDKVGSTGNVKIGMPGNWETVEVEIGESTLTFENQEAPSSYASLVSTIGSFYEIKAPVHVETMDGLKIGSFSTQGFDTAAESFNLCKARSQE